MLASKVNGRTFATQRRLLARGSGWDGLPRILSLALLGALLALSSAALEASRSEACRYKVAPTAVAHDAPSIIDEGFRSASRVEDKTRLERTHLWLQLDSHPYDAVGVLLEPVWGSGPSSLEQTWGKVQPIHNEHVVVHPAYLGPHRDQAFTLGVRARFVFSDGSVGPFSVPVFISHVGQGAITKGISAEHVAFALASLILLALWSVFRREKDGAHRIRLAAAIALVSLLFLAVSPALSWTKVQDPSGRLPSVQCHLGDEAQCATYVPDAGPNPLSRSIYAADRRFEVARWIGASTALRVGLILSMILLMPALIWLLVAPTLRPAQTMVAFGGSAAGYTLLATLFYRLTVPGWMSVSVTHAFDLSVLVSLNIVVSTLTVIYWSMRVASNKAELPKAVLLEGSGQ